MPPFTHMAVRNYIFSSLEPCCQLSRPTKLEPSKRLDMSVALDEHRATYLVEAIATASAISHDANEIGASATMRNGLISHLSYAYRPAFRCWQE